MRNMELYLIISYNFNKKEESLTPDRILTLDTEFIGDYMFQMRNKKFSDYAEKIFLTDKDEANKSIYIVTKFDGVDSMGLATLAFNDAGGFEFRRAMVKMLLSTALTNGFIDLRVLFEKFMKPRVPNIKDAKDREMVKSIVDMFIRKTTGCNNVQPVSVLPNENKASLGIRPDIMISAGVGEKHLVADTIMRSLEKHECVTVSYNENGGYIQCNIFNEAKKEMM